MADIAIRSVRKRYDATDILHGVDLDIASGEFIVILGPSGCGKSTLLRMIAGLESITSGEIAINGRVVNKLEPRERGCAMVFQNYALYPHMTSAENIGYALKVAGVPKAERRARVEKVAATLGLEPYLDRRPAALSGGQRQRVAMGRAMIREPGVFLFDEPLSNLDAQLRVQMRAEIRRLHKALGTTSIFVTHDQVEAMTMADRLIVMRAGIVEQVGTPHEVYARPASRFVAGFVGAPPMNLVEGHVNGAGDFVFGSPNTRTLALGRPDLAGQPVVLGVRAEDIALRPLGTVNTLAGLVDFIEEFGSARVLHVTVVGISLAVVLNEASPWRAGDALALDFAASPFHLFAAPTGLRLGEPTISDLRQAHAA
jgi:sn-glycerol 3-phosphate transport system ATP-binding protein